MRSRIIKYQEQPKYLMSECPLCKGEFRSGPNVYDGYCVAGWDIMVCDICYKMNWDGWHWEYNPILLKTLEARGVAAPPKNAKGFYPREFYLERSNS